MCRSEKCTTNGTERHAGRSLQGVCVKRKHLDKSEFEQIKARLREIPEGVFFFYFAQPVQPPPQFPLEQAQLSGQPMHFLPLFLDL